MTASPIPSPHGAIPWTRTSASINFCERTNKLFEFPDDVEIALEEDYFQNPEIYSDSVIRGLAFIKLLHPTGAPFFPEEVLQLVRELATSSSKSP